jgi:hypothetical protein
MTNDDLKAAERHAFRAVADTGVWDVFIAGVLAMFAIAPLLSGKLGDFWASAIFIPVWAAMYVALLFVRKRFLVPRVGQVRYGPYRKARLKRFTLVMLIVNVVALVVGATGFVLFERITGDMVYPATLAFTLLVGFSAAAYLLDVPRLFLYGVLLAGAPMVGEWLWRQGHVSHHGFPVMFGSAAAIIALVGLTKLVVIIRSQSPVVDNGA